MDIAKRKRIIIEGVIGILIVFVLAVGAGIVVIQRSSLSFDPRSFFTLLNAPQEVKDMLFITKIEGGEALARIRSGGIQTFAFPAKHFIQVARSGDIVLALALVEQTGSGAIDVYRVEGATLTPLTTDGGKKGGITVSPDGSKFAYSTEGPALPGAIEDAYDVRRYTTRIINTVSGEEALSLPGNHPYFLEGNLLLVLNERGFEVYDLETGAGNATGDDLAFLAIEPPLYSENGGFLVQNPVTNEFLLMKFASYDPVFPVLLAVFPAEEGVLFALKGENLYRSASSQGTFTLSRQGGQTEAGHGTTILSLPADVLNPLAIIP